MDNKLYQSDQISLIVVNYNSGEKLRQCIRSVTDACEGIDITVVDNASTDNSLELMEADFAGNLKLDVIRNQQNFGFSVSCNKGASKTNEKYLLFLNPDCLIDKATIPNLLRCLHSDKKIGMVGGLLLNDDGSEQAGGRRSIPTPWRTFVRIFKLSCMQKRYPRLFSDFNLHKKPLPDKPIEVEAISGACMLVTREALDDVGGLDENYFLHCEDLDWCMRFRQRGWKVYFVPDAKITHFIGSCSQSRPIFVEWNKHKGMMRFYRKFFKHQYPGVLMWLVAAGVWLRFSVLVMMFSFKRLFNTKT